MTVMLRMIKLLISPRFWRPSVRILVIGKSGRLGAILDSLKRSARRIELYVLSETLSPATKALAIDYRIGSTENVQEVLKFAREIGPDFVVIGPEEPLAAAIVDRLQAIEIPCVGPTKNLARLESSKSFTRDLIRRYGIAGNPQYRVFDNTSGILSYFKKLGQFVVKPDGLTGGKGVKIFPGDFETLEEAMNYCYQILEHNQSRVLIEELLEGEEFSLQSFCDGQHLVHTIPIQDHKRALDGDLGPNTGGMGSYSCENHLLPFLNVEQIKEACEINAAVASALMSEVKEIYKGIIYGSFIVTKDGLRVIEYNARFGDPEVMNLLPLLDVDFVDVCEAIISGNLDSLNITFKAKATVCKYIVPIGYPATKVSGEEIEIPHSSELDDSLRVYYGAVDTKTDGRVLLTSSRAVAVVGVAATLAEAERIAENAASKFGGPVYHRSDIGTKDLIHRRVTHTNRSNTNTEPAELHTENDGVAVTRLAHIS